MRKIHKVFDSSKVENWEVCLRVQRSKPLRKYKGGFPQLNESAVRLMWQKYEEELRQSLKEKGKPKTKLTTARHGRPLMPGKIDLMVQNYIRVRFWVC